MSEELKLQLGAAMMVLDNARRAAADMALTTDNATNEVFKVSVESIAVERLLRVLGIEWFGEPGTETSFDPNQHWGDGLTLGEPVRISRKGLRTRFGVLERAAVKRL